MAFEYLKNEKEISVSGFVQDIRPLGAIAFIILKRREGTLQLIIKKNENEDAYNKLKDITMQSFIVAKGEVVENKSARNGFEIKVKELTVENKSAPLPIDISGNIESDLSTRFDYRFLDLRQDSVRNIFELRSKVIGYTNEFFQKENFIAVNMPKITAIGAESGAELFKVDYFGKPAYLAQSPQFYKQMLQAAGFERVYEIGPVFRAEKSNTTRHLTEFIGVDMEMSYVTELKEIMDIEQEMFKYILRKLEKEDKELCEAMNLKFNVPDKFPVIEFDKALELLEKEYNYKVDDDDLDPEAERLLGKHFLEKENSDFVFVINYPISARPFYHMYNKDGKTTNSFDLLYKGVEITTGAIREHRLDLFISQAKEKGLNPNDMKEYVDIFKYGIPPHGGLGLGLDRVIQKLADIENVKECVLFPRDPQRMRP